MAQAAPERRAVPFTSFGGLRLDQAVDEVGGTNAIFCRDIDWDGSSGKLRPRDGFQKLKSGEASGTVKGLFPHSALRMLATVRVSSESLKLQAIDKEFSVKKEETLNKAEARPSFAHYGTPSASYTYMRTNTAEQKMIRFDGSEFKTPTATIVSFNEFGEESKVTGKEMPKGAFMATWPDAGNCLLVANTGTTGGPNGAASSASHLWISRPLSAEEWEERSYIQFSPGDGEEIQGIAVFGGQVFVFKETKFFVVYGVSAIEETGQPEYHFREVSLGEGSRIKVSSSSLLKESSDQICVASPTGVYFCTTDGIYVTTGGVPSKISQTLKPLEETIPFEGPMQEFLNGSNEAFRWPATGIISLGTAILVKRYEFIFKWDTNTQDWTCWKMPSVSAAIWTGLTGGGAEGVLSLPGTAEDSNAVGTRTWSNVNNVKVEDGSCASVELNFVNPQSHYLKATNFGFVIPEGSTVRGVTVEVRRRASLAVVSDIVVKLIKAGSVQGANKAKTELAEWPGALSFATYGGSEDLWGSTWTPAQINASNFGVALSCITSGPNSTGEVDVVKIAVYYSTSEASSGVRPRLFCSQSKFVYFTAPNAEEQAGTRQAEWQSGFYDLDDQDEKTLVESKLWGQGKVILSGYEDFKETALFSDEVEMPSQTSQGRSRKSTKPATLFSHRLKLEPDSYVQRLVRYLREKRTPTTDSDR